MLLGDRDVGPGHPCFVIAEAGVNHNGDLSMALELVEAAKEAGADAVKFQLFAADDLVTRSAPMAPYQVSRAVEPTQFEMLEALELPDASVRAIVAHARETGITFSATPFGFLSADVLASLDVPFLKVSSGDLTYLPFLRYLAAMGKPVVLSTGMASLDDVGRAVDAVVSAGAREIALLHCVSAYPTPPGEVNLLAMTTMHDRFDLPVGFSDHTIGPEVAVAAVALGATILEKHLTLDRTLPGPDHAASMEPDDFREMVAMIRSVESALGDGVKRVTASEAENVVAARRSIVAAVDLVPGTRLVDEMLRCQRPADGVSAADYDSVLGRRVSRHYRAGEHLAWDGLD